MPRTPGLDELPSPGPARTGWPWTIETPRTENELPRVTMVTPSFNQAQFLEETIRSVLLQGYPDLEYFIYDAGSTDGSVDIIKRYEPWLAGWVSEPDRGQSHAINQAWSRSSGQILNWINSDDFLTPFALQKVARCYLQDPDVGLICGLAAKITETGDVMSVQGEVDDLLAGLAEARNPTQQSACYVTRQAIEAVGLLDEELHYSMDWDLYVRIALKKRVINLKEVLSHSRKWSGAKTVRNRVGSASDHVAILRKLLSQKDTRARIRPFKNRALASAYARSAVLHFESRDIPRTSLLMAQACAYHPIAALRRAGLLRRRRFGRALR